MEDQREDISLKEFLKDQAGGKYTNWAADLDPQTLAALLWAIGEFAYRVNSATEQNWINVRIEQKMRVETGGWPAGRIGVALSAISEIAGGRRMTLNELIDRIRESMRS